MPIVTVGMPLYNGAAFVEHALTALTEQTYRNFVVLISDNASTDDTWEILEKWAARDERIVLHRQSRNIGPVENFRYVLDHAETEYFMWYAYDDWLAPNYLEELVAVLDADPRCGLACGHVLRVREDGAPKARNAKRPCPDLAGKTRRGRARTLLWRPEAFWIYGLFRTDRLRRVQALADEFGHVWSADRLMLLPFFLNDELRGSDRTTFYSRVTELSRRSYSPASLSARLRFVARYLVFNLRAYRASEMAPLDKLFLLPWLLRHVGRTSRSGIYRLYVKRPFKAVVSRLLRTRAGRLSRG